jgi:hypothetical protein
MAQDLVTQILQGLGSTATDQLSSAVGIDRATTQKAVGGAVPALLAGLVGVASRPDGGDRLSSLIGQLGNLGSADAVRQMSPDSRQTLTEQGSALLSSLFGGQGMDSLIGSVARYAGLDQGLAGKLLGFITPLVLGLLGRHAQASGAGMGGLAGMLLGQKDAIAGALPPALANRLQGSGLLSGIADRLGQGAATTTAAAKSSAAAIGQGVGATTSAAGGVPRWLYGLAAALIAAIVLYWLWGTGGVQDAGRRAAETPTQTEGSGTSAAVGRSDLGPQLTSAFDTTRNLLQQVTDPESAKKALPQLDDMVAQLDKLTSAAAQAPDQKKAMVEMAAKALPGIQELINKALAKPGVAEVLKPTLDAFKSKLAALAAA